MSVGSAPAPGSVMEKALFSRPSSKGSRYRGAVLLAARTPRSRSRSNSALPESGALLPNTTGAKKVRPSTSWRRPSRTWPNPIPPSSGGRCAAHRPWLFTSSCKRRDQLISVVVVEREGLEREDLLVHECSSPVELRLVLGLGLEIPGHGAPPLSAVRHDRYGGIGGRRTHQRLQRVAPYASDRPVQMSLGKFACRSLLLRTEARAALEAAGHRPPGRARELETRSWPAWRPCPTFPSGSLAALAHEVRLAWCGPDGRGGGDPFCEDRWMPRGLPLLLAVGPLRTRRSQATPFLDPTNRSSAQPSRPPSSERRSSASSSPCAARTPGLHRQHLRARPDGPRTHGTERRGLGGDPHRGPGEAARARRASTVTTTTSRPPDRSSVRW